MWSGDVSKSWHDIDVVGLERGDDDLPICRKIGISKSECQWTFHFSKKGRLPVSRGGVDADTYFPGQHKQHIEVRTRSRCRLLSERPDHNVTVRIERKIWVVPGVQGLGYTLGFAVCIEPVFVRQPKLV